ncbi:hypothetical protein E4U42_000294 [Claviceps africana]|uniref:histidinol-phosphate transaminase n=1 Tax=Claviceps africana TaxID=83212 RepID=A0A8K0J0V0_9HYPO|nr:hypothetical protein E4U42_000294 [Claviceps africana]
MTLLPGPQANPPPLSSDYKENGVNILLDANENAFGPAICLADIPPTTAPSPLLSGIDPLGLHRYPDPHQHDLKQLLCALRNTHAHTPKSITPDNLFVGVGSDEAIDALIRCFCTLSKAFGMAGIRLGAAFTSAPIARLLNSMKAPYNVPSPTSALARHALSERGLAPMRDHLARMVPQRERLQHELARIDGVGRLRGGTASNFLLYEILHPRTRQPDNPTALAVYKSLAEEMSVIVRFRGHEHGCEGCLRITVGTPDEVTDLLRALPKALDNVKASLSS